MSRSWREERTTPKEQPKKLPRPRVSDFAREYYQGKGYHLETPEEDTVTSSTIPNCKSPLDCLRDCDCGA